MIVDYDNYVSKNFDNMTEHQRDIYAYNSKHTIELKTSISSKSLNNVLLKHISPYFFMAKYKRG
jgi:hypothetical protein